MENGKCVRNKGLFGKVKGSRNLAFTIILSILAIIVLVTILNLAVNEIIPRPEFDDFCEPVIRILEPGRIQEDFAQDSCFEELEQAQNKNNQNIFFIFAGIGLFLIVVGLFIGNLLMQLIALGSGAVLVIESAIRNFQNTIAVIAVLSILLIIIVVVGVRRLED